MIPKLTAELIGTLWLVLGGCGSAVLAAAFPDVGIGLTGALPSSDLARVINGELAKAEALRKQGMAEADVYAARVRENMTTTPTR